MARPEWQAAHLVLKRNSPDLGSSSCENTADGWAIEEKRNTRDKIAALALYTCMQFELPLDTLLSIMLSFETIPISWSWLREDLALNLHPERCSLV